MRFQPHLLTVAVCTALSTLPAVQAQQQSSAEEAQIEKISITATRRAGTVQDAPLNITALDNDVMAQQNMTELADVARWVPGLTIPDLGGRDGTPLIVRGLNTNSSGPDSDGGTVATYLGEMPVQMDLRLVDIERVEVLIGPQGTLYGAGTLGGAIRYIAKEPEFGVTSGSVFGDISQNAESDSQGAEGGFILNLPLSGDTVALRTSLNYVNDPGFIDYNYLVRQPGVSLTDPDWSNAEQVDTHLRRKADANGEKILTGRIALRWSPNDVFDSTLNYYYQSQQAEGRSISHYQSLGADNPLAPQIGQYDSAYRYEEPNDLDDSLLSLEMKVDLDFAELVSATGLATSKEQGQRDQSDLLIRLDYGYEEFPAFSAFTFEDEKDETFTQELRLVSSGDDAFSWIVGGYYSNNEFDGLSKEFTPGFAEYALTEWETGGNPRPDALEYISVDQTKVIEKALFGELSYQVTDAWQVTLGTRFYRYSVNSASAIDLPLYNSVFDGAPSDQIILDFEGTSAKDNGNLLKFNSNYKLTEDLMLYMTVSEGFRIGGSNGVAPCPDPLPDDRQIVCALPSERLYAADTTTNYELGLKSSWLKNKLHLNAALFRVDWDDAQVTGATINGQQPITTNAATAKAQGLEFSGRAVLTGELSSYLTYAYTQAELTSDAPFLFAVVDDQGTELQDYYDGKAGDRLPGSPEHSLSFGLNYQTEVFDDKALDLSYGVTYQSDVYTKVGLRADAEVLPGYAVNNFSAKLAEEAWSVTFYIDNLFDKYAYTATRRDRGDIGLARFDEMNSATMAITF
ncbi:TonB-dependent receptor [Rheinheimera sp.]|uniref:TonB-dependent receptor n=1 Tax=Rheinheimera sp. TaxID=1869214 RepID=UPI00307F3A59